MPWRRVVNEMPARSFTLEEFLQQGANANLYLDLSDAELIMLGLEELGLIQRIDSPHGAQARWVRTAMYVQG